ncbi:MAG: ABC transporter substrate-binding protein [Pseudomonadota bacterium]
MVLKGMTWDHSRGYASLEAASHEFQEISGTTINWHRRSLQAFADEPIEQIAKDYDLIVLDHPHVGLIAETGCLHALPVPDNPEQVSIGGSLESYFWNGRQWALPIDAACQVAVQRKDLCEALPATWEDLVSQDFKKLNIVTPLLPVDAFDMLMTLVAGIGETHLPFSEYEFISSRSGKKALSIQKALYKRGPQEAINWNPITTLEVMSTTDEFTYSPCLFGYINYAHPGFRDHQLTYTDLPLFAGVSRRCGILGGAGIGVSSHSQYLEEAVKFATWVASEPVQSDVYIKNEGQPAHRQTWEKLGNDPDYAGFLANTWDTMSTAWTRPRDPWFLAYVDDVCAVYPDFFLKDLDPATFLATLNKLYRHHTQSRAIA